MRRREVLPPVFLFALIIVAGAGFALFNDRLRKEHHELGLHGTVTIGLIERVIHSHTVCNSSVVVSYRDVGGQPWRQTFQTCNANHVVGEALDVTYLRTAPITAMLRSARKLPQSVDS